MSTAKGDKVRPLPLVDIEAHSSSSDEGTPHAGSRTARSTHTQWRHSPIRATASPFTSCAPECPPAPNPSPRSNLPKLIMTVSSPESLDGDHHSLGRVTSKLQSAVAECQKELEQHQLRASLDVEALQGRLDLLERNTLDLRARLKQFLDPAASSSGRHASGLSASGLSSSGRGIGGRPIWQASAVGSFAPPLDRRAWLSPHGAIAPASPFVSMWPYFNQGAAIKHGAFEAVNKCRYYSSQW